MSGLSLRLLSAALFTLLAWGARAQAPVQATQQATLAQPDQAPGPVVIGCRMSAAPGNEPLCIIDGMLASPKQLAELNPGDIEKMDVLSAKQGAALYGNRGLNGVVLITSKPRHKQDAALLKQRQQQHLQQLR
ncbi:TonB-dependent receptor plug domain-containing protein [Hymenobacter sp. 15J16-1T3B]|uniref:TonB-dependent receptor plug domain-containing protein n=1 Tax=Hymenobacter sp. 15J16-1T3B TaxID=2886941 RepID=UPI001D0F6C2E|nr:TonB-dependent receptor plug domain-containing protein [Hymenobacter sp. 15J16-1T3B]MCC3156954.1 TonB-dependent receptor plug domain-containing protein [Hymenobacter sp. 15J16-1T3B]